MRVGFGLVRIRHSTEGAILVGQVSPGEAVTGHDLNGALECFRRFDMVSLFLISEAEVFPDSSVGLRGEIRPGTQMTDRGVELSSSPETITKLRPDKKIPGREPRRPLQRRDRLLDAAQVNITEPDRGQDRRTIGRDFRAIE